MMGRRNPLSYKKAKREMENVTSGIFPKGISCSKHFCERFFLRRSRLPSGRKLVRKAPRGRNSSGRENTSRRRIGF